MENEKKISLGEWLKTLFSLLPFIPFILTSERISKNKKLVKEHCSDNKSTTIYFHFNK